MNLKAILAGTAIATLALTAAPQLGAPAFSTQAEAATNISIGVFYDRLGGYGDWVNYRDQYVFIPTDVRADWRPYTLGHWVFARRYGWTWVSDEPFGWATYHYGRWGYAEDIGWYWVPGRRWAPAWVSWRRSNDYVVWAPLPPSRHGGVDVSININVGDIPDYYWVAVPTRRFLAPDLRVDVVRGDREIRQVVDRTEYVGTPRITNNIVVNNVIDVNVISQQTGEKVRTVDVKTTDNPADAKASADQVTVFQGELSADTKAKPQKLTDVTQVKKVKRNKAGTDANAPDQNNVTTAPATNNGATAPVDNTATAPADNSGTAAGSAQQPATTDATAPDTGKGKKKKVTTGGSGTAPADATATGTANAPVATPEKPAAQANDQPVGKKKKKQQNDNAAAPGAPDQPTTAQDQTTGKKKKKLQPSADESTGSTGTAPPADTNGQAKGQQPAPDQNANAPADNGKAKGKGKKNQPGCDPSTDSSCAPAQ